MKKLPTEKQAMVLNFMRENPNIKNPKRVANEMGLTPAMVNSHLKFLTKKGWLKKTQISCFRSSYEVVKE